MYDINSQWFCCKICLAFFFFHSIALTKQEKSCEVSTSIKALCFSWQRYIVEVRVCCCFITLWRASLVFVLPSKGTVNSLSEKTSCNMHLHPFSWDCLEILSSCPYMLIHEGDKVVLDFRLNTFCDQQ